LKKGRKRKESRKGKTGKEKMIVRGSRRKKKGGDKKEG
jgi:hypothetical protein